MKKNTICSIVGARPQFIKLAPLSKKLRNDFDEIIIHTGQHFDQEMSDLFFNELSIPQPNYNLDINKGGHGLQTGRMMIELEKIIQQIKPDLIIVFGDTNTTLAGALVGAKLQVKVIHIEAGLRSFNRAMPEEINRIAADHTSDYLFAPTRTAEQNLRNEGLENKSFLSGDIMADALLQNLEIAEKKSKIDEELNLSSDYFLLTLHRPYNVDNPDNLRNIISNLGELNKKIVFPVHPRTKKIIDENKISFNQNFILIEPKGYLDFIKLQKKSSLILTDSGGIQKEAYILKKICLTLRSETEWIETLEEGWNTLVDVKNQSLSKIVSDLKIPSRQKNVFGSDVSEKMTDYISEKIFF